ncbi:MAG: hypothetical protein GY953_25305 [bacterium]|nr:hypothetical protein [bacterium]
MSGFRITFLTWTALVAPAAPVEVGARCDATTSLTVWVYNYSKLPQPVLKEAKASAAKIFRLAGLEIEWVDPFSGCSRPVSRADLVLRLAPESMIPPLGLDSDRLAYSLVTEKQGRNFIAGVIVGRVERAAKRLECPFTQALGHVIAHELGHLLLGEQHHSVWGIMGLAVNHGSVAWDRKGHLGFLPSQAKRMRAEIRRRVEGERLRSRKSSAQSDRSFFPQPEG